MACVDVSLGMIATEETMAKCQALSRDGDIDATKATPRFPAIEKGTFRPICLGKNIHPQFLK